jgi:hypothetical protein
MEAKRKEKSYKDLSDNDLADEVLAELVGNKGEKDFLESLDKQQLPISEKLKQAIADFWKRVKAVFTKQSPNIKDWTMEQFQNAKIEDIVNNVTADLLGGKKVSDVSSEQLADGRNVFNKIKEVKSIKEMMGKLNDSDLLGYMEQNNFIKSVPCA